VKEAYQRHQTYKLNQTGKHKHILTSQELGHYYKHGHKTMKSDNKSYDQFFKGNDSTKAKVMEIMTGGPPKEQLGKNSKMCRMYDDANQWVKPKPELPIT
jgi:hypothetical protein